MKFSFEFLEQMKEKDLKAVYRKAALWKAYGTVCSLSISGLLVLFCTRKLMQEYKKSDC